jgi:hypothetical protein
MALNNNGTVAGAAALAGAAASSIAAATEFSPSGAPRQTSDIDPEHPAVDNDPRSDTTSTQNRIDFNDPNLSGAEAVQKNLEAQGSTVASGDTDKA